MIDGVIFIILILVVICICLGCFFTDCCVKICDEEVQIEENDITISNIYKDDDAEV